MSTPGLGLGIPAPPSDPMASFRTQVTVAEAGMRRHANWFDWIAVFSIINSVISMFNGNWHFLLGLGITEIVDYIAQKSDNSRGQWIGFAVTAVVAGFFWLMGRFAKQGQRWALILGMVLYALDGGLLILGQDWLSVAFHAYALFMLAKTFGAIKRWEDAKHTAEAHGVFLGMQTG